MLNIAIRFGCHIEYDQTVEMANILKQS